MLFFKELKTRTLVLLLLALTSGIGCQSRQPLTPIDGKDIVFLSKGDTYTANEDGLFMTEEYFKHILRVKQIEADK